MPLSFTLPPFNFTWPTATATATSLGVVITGSTKGVGRALAEAFLERQDRVIIASRTSAAVEQTVLSFQRQFPQASIHGVVADVRLPKDVEHLADFASEKLGSVDAFICNAGMAGRRRLGVGELNAEEIKEVVDTNLLGALYCAKHGYDIIRRQSKPLHMFLVDGSGTAGNATGGYAAYGATKRAFPQLVKSLNKEAEMKNIRFHSMSPGMVLTDLLLSGNTEAKNRKIFNYLADEPETVAQNLVPRLRDVVINDTRNSYVRYLTIPKAAFRLSTGFLLGFRNNLFFDVNTGNRIERGGTYSNSGVRLRE